MTCRLSRRDPEAPSDCFRWHDGDAYDVAIVDYHWGDNMRTKKIAPVHPGEILMEEFLKPMSISQYRLAKDISVPARRVNEIVHGQRAISADTALRLGKYFGMSPQFWTNLQSHYELEMEEDRIGAKLSKEVHVLVPAYA